MLPLWKVLLVGPLIWCVAGEAMAIVARRSMRRWAPARVPFERRLQTLSIALLTSLLLTTFLFAASCVLNMKSTWWWFIPYLVFCWWDKAPFTGTRKIEWYRRLSFWNYCTKFFPMSLVKANDEIVYKDDRPYLFGYHPHGVFSLGMVLNFGTEATGVSRLLPGLNIYLATINYNIMFPFLREFTIPLGSISVERRSIESILQRGAGYGAVIVVGGAHEASLARPGMHELVLHRRKGFFRLALKYGVRLVPVYCFGENNMFSSWEVFANPSAQTISLLVKKLFGFVIPYVKGRGLFQYEYGFLPKRHPLNSVIGLPIDCDRIPNPTDEDVEKLQKKYMSALKELFETQKHKYCLDPQNEVLTFVE